MKVIKIWNAGEDSKKVEVEVTHKMVFQVYYGESGNPLYIKVIEDEVEKGALFFLSELRKIIREELKKEKRNISTGLGGCLGG